MALAVLSGLLMAPKIYAAASNNPLNQACSNIANGTSVTCNQASGQGTNNPISGSNGVINKAANIIALVAGVGAVIVIIISGFMFVTAGGASPGQRSSDPNKVRTARAALTGAIIGLVVIALAWAIIKFITTKLVQ